MKIIEKEFSDDDIKNVIIKALEAGVDYYYLDGFPEFPDKELYIRLLNHIFNFNELSYPIYDVEYNELIGHLSYKNIKNGLQLFLKNGYIFDSNLDIKNSDILFQYIVTGDVYFK